MKKQNDKNETVQETKKNATPQIFLRVIAMIAAICTVMVVFMGYSVSKKVYDSTPHVPKKDTTNNVIQNTSDDTTEEETTETTADTADTTANTTEEITSEEVTETTEAETTADTTIDVDTSGYAIKEIKLDRYTLTLDIGEDEMPMVTMLPEGATKEQLGEIWETSNPNVATVSKYGRVKGVSYGQCIVKVTSVNNPFVYAEVSVTIRDSKAVEAKYINGVLIANKTYPLPSNYNPGNNAEAVAALNTMIADANAAGLNLFMRSGFRSYNDQKTIYRDYVTRNGQAEADTYSARPGHSEHQTGLAFDLNVLEQSFGTTAEGIWLAENCHKYGFIIRYPQGKEHITGYIYEPWHVRYLGVETATKVYESGLCLEEYFGITSKYAH